MLHLDKGQRAVLETVERFAMPWDLAGNLGIKYRMGVEGLFVSPGLFVDPGFGWVTNESSGAVEPAGAPLRFMVTNVGDRTISLQLGERGTHVLGIQFLAVEAPAVQRPVNAVDVDPQGLAFFEDLRRLEAEFAAVKTFSERTEMAIERVVVFGVFLVALATVGASMSFLLAAVASGTVDKVIKAVNGLETHDHPWSVSLVVSTVIIALTCMFWIAKQVAMLFRFQSGAKERRSV